VQCGADGTCPVDSTSGPEACGANNLCHCVSGDDFLFSGPLETSVNADGTQNTQFVTGCYSKPQLIRCMHCFFVQLEVAWSLTA
jgi:hypothetical protein